MMWLAFSPTYTDQSQSMEISLIQRIQAQDQSVISQLYDDYGAALYGVVYRITGTKEVAEQVIQDTFVKVWRNGPSYDTSKGRLFTWMMNIARNTAIDAIRTTGYKNQTRTESLSQSETALPADQPDPHLMDVRSIVDKLDDKYRVLVQKIYFEGYSQSEVSEELDIPLGTVKTRLRAAMQELRGMVGENSYALAGLLTVLSKSL
jgi:RNA polymerase sigma-70 factor, ECF subfamily